MPVLRRLLVFAFALVFAPMAAAQPDLPVQVNLDQASFAYNDQQSLLEIYLAFGARSLAFEQDSAGFRARLPVDLTMVHDTETDSPETPSDPVWADSLMLSFAVPDTSGFAAGQHFVHQVRAAVPPGEYELRVRVPEGPAGDRKPLALRRDVVVPDYAERDAAHLSDMTLASQIQVSENRRAPFYKNGLIVRPNPNHMYGRRLNQLFYYAEAYGASQIAGDDGQYTIYTYVSEANSTQPAGELEERTRREARSPDVLVGSFDLSALPSGTYFLHLALLGQEKEAQAEQARKFYVYNPQVKQTQQPAALKVPFESSPFAALPKDKVEEELAQIELIANSREQQRIDDLDEPEPKRRYLMRFWRKRDPAPNTPTNEFREDFLRRVHYANERYSTNYQQGWQSDRGRTLIKYGRPGNIKSRLYERNRVPHEIWQYDNIHGEGQATFVFADRSGFGRFELIHSTVAGERSLPNWREELVQ